MAHNASIHAGGWATGYVVTSADFLAIDSLLFKSINGDDGGTWAPSSLITIGGSGLRVTGPFTSSYSTLIDASLTVSDTATFNNLTTVNAQFRLTGTGGFLQTGTGPVNFSGYVTTTAGLLVSSPGTFICNAISSFTQTVSINAALALTGGGGMSCGDLATFNGGVRLNGGGSLSCHTNIDLYDILRMFGAARLIYRRITGADAATTYAVADADLVQIPNLAANRIYTISSTGAQSGDVMTFSMASDAKTVNAIGVTLQRTDTSNIGPGIQKAAGGYVAMTIVFDGTTWQPLSWCPYSP